MLTWGQGDWIPPQVRAGRGWPGMVARLWLECCRAWGLEGLDPRRVKELSGMQWGLPAAGLGGPVGWWGILP